MKRIVASSLLLTFAISVPIYAKLAKFVHEVEMNPKEFTNWQAYFPLVEKYLSDIKDSLYKSCVPALQQIKSLSVQNGMDLTVATFRTIKLVDEYAEAKGNTALLNEIRTFSKKYYDPALEWTQKYPQEERNQYIHVTSKSSGIVSPGGAQRWIVQNLENDFCTLMRGK